MEYRRTQITATDKYGREILFDSITEYEYWCELLKLEEQGKISNIEIHPEFVLQEPFEYFGKKINAIVYTPDFMFKKADGTVQAIEIKGIPTPDFELRLKIWKYKYRNIPIKIICWSKKTGFMEIAEYKKARAIIKRESIENRLIRQQEQRREKKEARIKRLLERKQYLETKPKLTKKEIQRLEEIRGELAHED